jgi:hypothetical protein
MLKWCDDFFGFAFLAVVLIREENKWSIVNRWGRLKVYFLWTTCRSRNWKILPFNSKKKNIQNRWRFPTTDPSKFFKKPHPKKPKSPKNLINKFTSHPVKWLSPKMDQQIIKPTQQYPHENLSSILF